MLLVVPLVLLLHSLLLFRYLYLTAGHGIQPNRTSDGKRSQILTRATVLVAAGFYRKQWTHPHIPQQLARTASAGPNCKMHLSFQMPFFVCIVKK
uniref:Putative secreted peptide n=1 Tax=Anopheles braziliensis TaxID=58242 RepID=A0A2M3ZU40_9DIPT